MERTRFTEARDFKGFGEQCITNQYGNAFVVSFMDGWLTTAEIIIIHTWQVVMDKRVGVNEFYRRCRCIRIFFDSLTQSF